MLEPKLKIVPTTSALSSCSPQLMPFHVSYTGPAPISTFFRPRNAQSTLPEAPSNLASRSSVKKRLLATFRGREIHGLEVPIPEGYGGVVLRSEGPKASSSSSHSIAQKKSDNLKKGGRRSLRNLRGAKAVVEIDEDVKEENASLDPEDSTDGIREESDAAPAKRLTPSQLFSSLVIWNADFAVDEGREEYIQSLDEWINLSSELHLSED